MMELVYLWVEDYKNIKRQGFNFSPRFEVEFTPSWYKIGNSDGDPDDKLSARSPLSIIQKSSDSLFPQNINITAIVGKNGTGKSRILKLLYGIQNNLSEYKNSFAIFYDNTQQEKYFYLGDEKKFQCLKTYVKLTDTAFALFDYSLTYSPEFNYDKDALIYPKKQINSIKGAISLTQELIGNQKNILLNYFKLEKNNQLDKFKDFFVAEKIIVEFNSVSFQNKINNENKNKGLLEAKNQEIQTTIQNIKVGQTLKDFIGNLKTIRNILNDENSYKKKDGEEKIDFDNLFFPNWFQWCERSEQDDQINNVWQDDFKKADWDTFIDSIKVTSQKLYKEIADEGESNVPSYEVLSCEVRDLNQGLIEIILASFGQEYFRVKLIDKNAKVLNDLSFGEQQLIFILNQLFALKYEKFSAIEEVEDENSDKHDVEISKNIQNYIVLLDEIDIGFHPDWQKRAVHYICDFLKLIPEKNFHLVFATHSPFLLSDLAKENVIFLEKDTNGNCKNVTKETSIETFGANIHTLLSHGFFMKDGLMGEFAKEKINEAIKYLNQKTLTEKEIDFCEHIISIIGEPILKRQLQKMLDSKKIHYLAKDTREEIEFLKHRINLLSKRL